MWRIKREMRNRLAWEQVGLDLQKHARRARFESVLRENEQRWSAPIPVRCRSAKCLARHRNRGSKWRYCLSDSIQLWKYQSTHGTTDAFSPLPQKQSCWDENKMWPLLQWTSDVVVVSVVIRNFLKWLVAEVVLPNRHSKEGTTEIGAIEGSVDTNLYLEFSASICQQSNKLANHQFQVHSLPKTSNTMPVVSTSTEKQNNWNNRNSCCSVPRCETVHVRHKPREAVFVFRAASVVVSLFHRQNSRVIYQY